MAPPRIKSCHITITIQRRSEVADAPYVLGDKITYTIREGESEFATTHRRHGFGNRIQRYDRVADILEPQALRHGLVFGTECWLIEATEMWSACAEKIRNDPYYFIDEA